MWIEDCKVPGWCHKLTKKSYIISILFFFGIKKFFFFFHIRKSARHFHSFFLFLSTRSNCRCCPLNRGNESSRGKKGHQPSTFIFITLSLSSPSSHFAITTFFFIFIYRPPHPHHIHIKVTSTIFFRSVLKENFCSFHSSQSSRLKIKKKKRDFFDPLKWKKVILWFFLLFSSWLFAFAVKTNKNK